MSKRYGKARRKFNSLKPVKQTAHYEGLNPAETYHHFWHTNAAGESFSWLRDSKGNIIKPTPKETT